MTETMEYIPHRLIYHSFNSNMSKIKDKLTKSEYTSDKNINYLLYIYINIFRNINIVINPCGCRSIFLNIINCFLTHDELMKKHKENRLNYDFLYGVKKIINNENYPFSGSIHRNRYQISKYLNLKLNDVYTIHDVLNLMGLNILVSKKNICQYFYDQMPEGAKLDNNKLLKHCPNKVRENFFNLRLIQIIQYYFQVYHRH